MPQASDDLQIFVFPARDDAAQENLDKSINNPIPNKKVFDSFDKVNEGLREKLERIREDGNGFYAWGAQPRGHAASTWKKMNRGDYVLGYHHKAYHYVSRVLETFHDSTLATNIWGTDPKTENTWEYMYFLTKPTKINKPASWVADLLGRDEKSLIYQMFARMSGENRDAVLDTCKSVQAFIDRLLDYEGDGVPPQHRVASRRSEDVAETSLETDQVAFGEPTQKSVPSEEGRKLIRKHVTYERKPENRALAIPTRRRVVPVAEPAPVSADDPTGEEEYEQIFLQSGQGVADDEEVAQRIAVLRGPVLRGRAGAATAMAARLPEQQELNFLSGHRQIFSKQPDKLPPRHVADTFMLQVQGLDEAAELRFEPRQLIQS